ncbi:MAG: hypothetical protein LAT78_06150 [Roseinatronobacter sp.]|nr:hypothetical protein [Roseinatronobacter sp.]
MDHATLYMMGFYLLPLAFVSSVSAWARGHRPIVALALVLTSVALIGFVAIDRDEGMYPVTQIPELTTYVIGRIMAQL